MKKMKRERVTTTASMTRRTIDTKTTIKSRRIKTNDKRTLKSSTEGRIIRKTARWTEEEDIFALQLICFVR